jgi:hypothetical protein
LCDPRQTVPILVVIAERARAEEMPQPIVAEFDLCAQPDVSCEQTDQGRFGERIEFFDEFLDAGTGSAAGPFDPMRQEKDVGVKEALHTSRCDRNLVSLKAFADEGGIGAAGEVHASDGIGNPKLERKGALPSFDAGATGPNQGAVNIKKNDLDPGA